MARRGEVELAVRRDLRQLDISLRRSGLAMAAIELAHRLDRPGCDPCDLCGCEGIDPTTDRDAATVTAELRQVMAELRKVKPAKQQEDSLAQRRARRAATRGAAG